MPRRSKKRKQRSSSSPSPPPSPPAAAAAAAASSSSRAASSSRRRASKSKRARATPALIQQALPTIVASFLSFLDRSSILAFTRTCKGFLSWLHLTNDEHADGRKRFAWSSARPVPLPFRTLGSNSKDDIDPPLDNQTVTHVRRPLERVNKPLLARIQQPSPMPIELRFEGIELRRRGWNGWRLIEEMRQHEFDLIQRVAQTSNLRSLVFNHSRDQAHPGPRLTWQQWQILLPSLSSLRELRIRIWWPGAPPHFLPSELLRLSNLPVLHKLSVLHLGRLEQPWQHVELHSLPNLTDVTISDEGRTAEQSLIHAIEQDNLCSRLRALTLWTPAIASEERWTQLFSAANFPQLRSLSLFRFDLFHRHFGLSKAAFDEALFSLQKGSLRSFVLDVEREVVLNQDVRAETLLGLRAAGVKVLVTHDRPPVWDSPLAQLGYFDRAQSSVWLDGAFERLGNVELLEEG